MRDGQRLLSLPRLFQSLGNFVIISAPFISSLVSSTCACLLVVRQTPLGSRRGGCDICLFSTTSLCRTSPDVPTSYSPVRMFAQSQLFQNVFLIINSADLVRTLFPSHTPLSHNPFLTCPIRDEVYKPGEAQPSPGKPTPASGGRRPSLQRDRRLHPAFAQPSS